MRSGSAVQVQRFERVAEKGGKKGGEHHPLLSREKNLISNKNGITSSVHEYEITSTVDFSSSPSSCPFGSSARLLLIIITYIINNY